jgi:hypothetical protein
MFVMSELGFYLHFKANFSKFFTSLIYAIFFYFHIVLSIIFEFNFTLLISRISHIIHLIFLFINLLYCGFASFFIVIHL